MRSEISGCGFFKALLMSGLVLSFVSNFAYSSSEIDSILRSLNSSKALIESNSSSYSARQIQTLQSLAEELNQEARNSDPSNPSECYNKALSVSGINYDTAKATDLCAKGGTLSAVDCFNQAYSTSGINYDSALAIRLCKNAGNPERVACYEKAYPISGINYDTESALQLCEAGGTAETVACFQKAHPISGINFDRNKTLNLCARGGTLANVSCFERQYPQSGYNAEAAINLCAN